MIRLIAGLTRSLPLVIALIVIAIVAYLIISYVRTPLRAKEILIKVFLVLCSVIAIFFALVSIYAIVDDNGYVFELAVSCAGVGVVGLLITLACRHVFRKNHPHYRKEPTGKAKVITNKPDVLDAVIRVLNFIKVNKRNR